jgi:mannose-6-phosphate isomerase
MLSVTRPRVQLRGRSRAESCKLGYDAAVQAARCRGSAANDNSGGHHRHGTVKGDLNARRIQSWGYNRYHLVSQVKRMSPLYPLRFRPILRRLIWGGRRLGTVLHKPIGDPSDYAESWELSDYHDSVSVVEEGPLAGTTLRELVKNRGLELLGRTVGRREQFPLLVKFIDANQVLSVQVHPDQETGRRLADDNGKTETWVVLDAEPGSLIYSGLKAGVGPDELARSIQSGSIESLLHAFEPKAGDSILIEAGTVHAIGAGVLLSEIQQMSDATFRVYDWNRVGPDGKPRELHISQAMESINFDRGPVDPIKPQVSPMKNGTRERLARSAYFALERLSIDGPACVGQSDRFTILMGLKGQCGVAYGGESVRLEFGQTLLLPAMIGECEIIPHDNAVVLSCVVP